MEPLRALVGRRTSLASIVVMLGVLIFPLSALASTGGNITTDASSYTVTAGNGDVSSSLPTGNMTQLANHIPGSQGADQQCVPGDYTCQFPQMKNGVQCMYGFHCWDVVNGTTVNGSCQQANLCLGQPMGGLPSGSNSGGLSSLLGGSNSSLLSGLMQGLMGAMSGSGSGSGSGSSASSANPNTCTTQYYYTSNPSASDPCAVYAPNGGQNTLPTSPAPDSGISDLLKGLNIGQPLAAPPANPSSTGGSTDNSQSPLSSLLNTMTDGSGTIEPTGTQCPVVSPLTSCQAGYGAQDGGLDQNGCVKPQVCVPLTSASSTISDLSPTALGDQAGDQSAPDQQSEPVPVSDLISNQTLYNNNTSSSTPAASQTPLNQNPIPVPQNGLHGDLLSFGGGVTIFARSRSNNTEVSGFYGSSGTAQSLCASRPWANNFLSYIIPPSFFDNLCSWGGVPGQASGQGLTSVSGAGNSSVQVVAGPKAPTTAVPQLNSDVAPYVKISASPPTVNLGGRTTVFWVSKNVASCEESSSDGNFRGTTVSGGASTVALSGPVTFTIVCIGLNGDKTEDSYTVQIGI